MGSGADRSHRGIGQAGRSSRDAVPDGDGRPGGPRRGGGAAADGASNPDIAIRLQLSPHTVRNHVQHIFARLGAHSRLEAVTIGLRGGLTSPPSGN